jgi:hypothetical protein
MDAKIPVPLIIGSTPVGRGFMTLFVVEDIATKMSRFIQNSLIIADIEVKILEYPGALSLSGPLSALGGALPGLSSAIGTITNVLSGVSGALNITTTAASNVGKLGQFGSAIGGVLNTLSGATSANRLTSLLSTLSPGAVTQITAPTAAMMKTALANLRAAGH